MALRVDVSRVKGVTQTSRFLTTDGSRESQTLLTRLLFRSHAYSPRENKQLFNKLSMLQCRGKPLQEVTYKEICEFDYISFSLKS